MNEKGKYRVRQIEGVDEVRLPAPDPEKVRRLMEEGATARSNLFALRFGDKVVYVCLAVALVAKIILMIRDALS